MVTTKPSMRKSAASLAAVLLLVLYGLNVQAQTGGIHGRVTDERDRPVAGASVSIRELNRAAGTDDDGRYSFQNVPAGNWTVAVSHVGYQDAERKVAVSAGVATVDIRFASQGTQDLDEVVVIGYGTVRKRDLTGSVVSVGEKDFNKGVVSAPDQLIQGKSAGVMVVNNTGRPGGGTTVRIRGNSSLRSGNNPLFVVDGIPLSGTAARPGTSGGEYEQDDINPLAHLNPADIASIDVLKDASATAIYGSRGANGVVLITTKRGRVGAPRLGVQASTGTSSVLKKLEMLSGDEFRQALDAYGIPRTDNDFRDNVDAFDAVTRTAVTQNHSVDVSGGGEANRYRVSVGYFDQQGIVQNSGMQKLTASLNSSFTFLESKKLTLDIGIMAAQTSEDMAPTGGTVGRNILSYAMQWNPTRPLRQPDGSLTWVERQIPNPLAALEAYKDEARLNTVIANFSPSYRITDYLVYKFAYGLTQQSGRRTGRNIRELMDDTGESKDNGSAFAGSNTELNHQLTHTLSFDKEVANGLNLNALLGYEWLSYDARNFSADGDGFSQLGLEFYDYLHYSRQVTRGIRSYRGPTNELQSYFARASLNWRDRFLFTGTIRRDGSTKFGANNKYATFPSLALAWNLHNEAFLQNNATVSSLKLRGGWGRTGNSEFPSGAARDRYVFGSQTVSQANFGNPDLKWESSATVNVGLDFGLFQDRLSGSLEYFDKRTTDALFERTVARPAPSGGAVWVNLPGEIRNHGVEVALNGAIVQKENWDWSLGLNATWLKNTVSGLLGDIVYEIGGGQRIEDGRALNTWYLPKFEGIDPVTGMSLFRALDGSIGTQGGGVEPSLNRHYMGSPSPKYLLGFSTSARYKRLTGTLNANGALGHWIMNRTMNVAVSKNLPKQNIARAVFDPALLENRVNPGDQDSDRFLEKGDYLKLANLTLSYDLGTLAGGLKNFNVSLTGQNLLVLTGYKGFDPELANAARSGGYGIPVMGIENMPYPPVRTFLLGVNFSL